MQSALNLQFPLSEKMALLPLSECYRNHIRRCGAGTDLIRIGSAAPNQVRVGAIVPCRDKQRPDAQHPVDDGGRGERSRAAEKVHSCRRFGTFETDSTVPDGLNPVGALLKLSCGQLTCAWAQTMPLAAKGAEALKESEAGLSVLSIRLMAIFSN